MTKKEDVDKLTTKARAEYKARDERVDKMTDEDVELILFLQSLSIFCTEPRMFGKSGTNRTLRCL